MSQRIAYDPEPLIEAITACDWAVDHVGKALDAIRATSFPTTGERLSDEAALRVLLSLVEQNRVRPKTDLPAVNIAETGIKGPARKAKYFVVPDELR